MLSISYVFAQTRTPSDKYEDLWNENTDFHFSVTVTRNVTARVTGDMSGSKYLPWGVRGRRVPVPGRAPV